MRSIADRADSVGVGSHRSRRSRIRGSRGSASLIMVLLGAGALAIPGEVTASLSTGVTVSVSEIHNNGQCLDGWPFENERSGCSKADFFAIAKIVRDNGGTISCGPSSITRNADNVILIPPEVLSSCSNTPVAGDFTVTLEVWDADDLKSPPERADQADLAAGPELGWTTPFRFGPGNFQPRTFTTSGGPTTAIFTVSPIPLTTTLTLSTPVPGVVGLFDPTLGEVLNIQGTTSFPTRVRVTARERATGATYLIADAPINGRNFNFTWDGRVSPGALQSVGSGRYDIVVEDRSPSPAPPVVGVVDVAPRPPATLLVSRIYPKPTWDFRNGPLTIDVLQSSGGSVRLSIRQSDCTGALVRTYPAKTSAAGLSIFDWDGKDDGGTLVPNGTYCLLFDGTTAAGRPMIGTQANVIANQGDGSLELAVGTSPAAPFLLGGNAGGVHIVAEALTSTHQPREAANFNVEVSAFALGWLPQTWAPMTFSCQQVRVCVITVPPSMVSAASIAYRVTASEAEGIPNRAEVTTSIRLTDTTQQAPPSQARVYRVNAAGFLDGGQVKPVQPANGIDVVYYPATGYDLGDPASAADFSDTVGLNVRQLLGVAPSAFPSSVMRHFDRVSVFVALSPARVDHTGGASPLDPRTDLCVASGLDPVSFGDVHGILHTVDCRNNASWSGHWFTANAPTVGWHEFHHAAYGESDEYCCDGGYAHGVDLYGSMSECQRDGSNPQTCAALTGVVPGTTTMTTLNEWRSDTDPQDVMIFNINEDADDRRAAENRYQQCEKGLC